MSKTAKKILKYGGILFFLGITLLVSNELFIRDWRIAHSEKRVQKSSKLNFQNKIEKFKKFKDYIQNLEINPVTEIEFLGGDKISGNLSSHSMNDSIYNSSAPIYFSSDNEELEIDVEFELRQNGLAKVNYLDTVFETHNWRWNFNGNKKDKDFKKFIEYAGITEKDLESLRSKIKELDCETIWIHKDKSVSIRFDGFSMHQYEYYFPSEMGKAPSDYEKLDEGIYAGFYDDGLFCGWMIIFNK